MPMPTDVGIVDTMIGFPAKDFEHYEFIRKQLKDAESAEFDFPVEYMFKGVPKEKYGADDPIALTLGEMDAHGVEFGLIGCEGEVNRKALADHSDRFVATCQIDANDVMGAVRKIRHCKETYDIRAVGTFPAGCFPQIPIDDAKWYPVYATCCDLDIPVFVCAGVPGPRLPMDCQHVERIDRVMYDFPELTLVTRHGCEPWEDLAVKLMLKWPGLHYSTSAFAPKHYPSAIVDYANTRGADKIMYAGYFPMGLSLQRIMTEMPNVGLPRRGLAQVPAPQRRPSLLENHPDVLFTVAHYDGTARCSSGSPTPTSTTSPTGSRTATGGWRRPHSSGSWTPADHRDALELAAGCLGLACQYSSRRRRL